VATDAPLLPHQLKRMATRVSLGVGRQGGFGGNSSGDIFVAFSTANPRAWFNDQPVTDVKMLPNDRITPLFQATAQATDTAAREPERSVMQHRATKRISVARYLTTRRDHFLI